jgi:hypothetical protein
MSSLGFENYAEALKIYLSKYREVVTTPLIYHPMLHPPQLNFVLDSN